MSFDEDLVKGVAQLLVARIPSGLGLSVTWSDNGVYTSAQTGIVHRDLPATLDRCIALSPYPVADDYALSESTVGLQVRTRWEGADPRRTDRLADAVFDVLHGLHGVTLSTGIHVVSAVRRSGVSMGQDSSKRWGRSDNYYLDVHRPSPNRT